MSDAVATEENRRRSRLKRWIMDWSTMTTASVAIAAAVVATFSFVGWEFPLVLEKAYAQDQKETHMQLAQMDERVARVEKGLNDLSTQFIEGSERSLKSELREMVVWLAAGTPNAQVRRLLEADVTRVEQELSRIDAELRRRGVR